MRRSYAAPAAAGQFTGSVRERIPVARFGNPLDSGELADSDLSDGETPYGWSADQFSEKNADDILGTGAKKAGWGVFKRTKSANHYVIRPDGETISGIAAGQRSVIAFHHRIQSHLQRLFALECHCCWSNQLRSR